jgi:hypothetical protein
MAAFLPSPFEPAMAALFAHLVAAATFTFTADATATSPVLASVSAFTGLFAGMPVFGAGVEGGAVIQSLNPGAGTVTLSAQLGTPGTAVSFTTGFLTTGRRVQHWTQVNEQPALFLRRTGSEDHYSGEMPITELDCEVWIYSNAGQDGDAIPDEALSNLDWMIRSAFAPDLFGDFVRCTLGNAVYRARVEGHSDYSPGEQGGQGISRIPVRLTLNPT